MKDASEGSVGDLREVNILSLNSIYKAPVVNLF